MCSEQKLMNASLLVIWSTVCEVGMDTLMKEYGLRVSHVVIGGLCYPIIPVPLMVGK